MIIIERQTGECTVALCLDSGSARTSVDGADLPKVVPLVQDPEMLMGLHHSVVDGHACLA